MDLRLVSLPVYITSGVTCLNDLLVYLDNTPFSKAKEDPNFKLSLESEVLLTSVLFLTHNRPQEVGLLPKRFNRKGMFLPVK